MSQRYPPPEFRGPRDRSRSPPRFDRRQSAASINFDRRAGPPGSDAPRGPRSQLDGPARPPAVGGVGSSGNVRPAFNSLRDAPPLGSGERGRPFRERERDWERDRRERIPSPRERSPSRPFKDARDFPPRDLDVGRARRGSRDGPPSAGSNFSDNPAFAPAPSRGGYFPRGRGRGEFSYRGGRGGRPPLDDRDLFRRERSPPPPRWDSRDLPREEREPERRERFDRREDERRPSDWMDRDREREREAERFRREGPPPRLESRASADSLASANAPYQSAQAPPINPARLALIEGSGNDAAARRASIQSDSPSVRDARRDQPDSSYMNGRAETTANRYASRGSSSPTQAPPVPVFTLSSALSAPAQSQPPPATSQPTLSTQKPEEAIQVSEDTSMPDASPTKQERNGQDQKPDPPAEAPTAPKAPPPAPRAQLISPPVAAPRAPRAYENETSVPAGSRLQGVRSLENIGGPTAPPAPGLGRPDAPLAPPRSASITTSPRHQSSLPTLVQPKSPRAPRNDLVAPTAPRAARMSPAQASVSPRPPLASPRSDAGAFGGQAGTFQAQTPPPSAPSGPRNRSFSVSPKVEPSAIPTAPKAERAPPTAPRSLERGPAPPARPNDRLGAPPPWGPPSAPRGGAPWNQWRKPGPPSQSDKVVPAKRDVLGEEKPRNTDAAPFGMQQGRDFGFKPDNTARPPSAGRAAHPGQHKPAEINPDKHAPRRQASAVSGHSAARSFFGQPTVNDAEEENGGSDAVQGSVSTSEESESDLEEDLALFNAKFERRKRQLEAQMADLSSRHYRATTPLESIARLSRISMRDLQRVNEQREHDMEVDASPALQNRQMHHRPSHSSDSGDAPDIVTPRGDDDHRVAIRASDESSDSQLRRARRAIPEPVSLPYLLKEARPSLHESAAFKEGLKRHEESQTDVLGALEDELAQEQQASNFGEEGFGVLFDQWREVADALDFETEENDRKERHESLEPRPEIEPIAIAPINPIAEGRRLHKYSTEYALEQVLKQSEETARIERENQDKEKRKNLADMEKEAKLPYQRTTDEVRRAVFVDSNTLRNPEGLSVVFSYEPPVDTFTETEQQIFIGAFKETPKKWGEIASLLPGRTYKDCIHHYYANKWDGRFRDTRAKKYKGGARRGGRGRGRGRVGGIMADLPVGHDLGLEAMSEKGRPRRAAAPTNFAEKEAEAKANLLGPSPAKKPGPVPKAEANGEVGPEKPGKRQKRTGEKPGRKSKATQPLAQLAPQASPAKQFMALPGMQTQDDMARQKKLEEASLLTGFHGGHHSMLNPDAPMVYTQEGFIQPMQMPEETERPKASAPPAKQSASSYWSVPEQNDFVKYIGYFGKDFGAIAAHMGTKTQTMIKNHYQRQVDGGSRPELEQSAMLAEERRRRGEDLGPPPQPTPIVKRKYDNPQPPTQRPLAPHTDAMEVDEPGPAARAQVPKHASPPQYQTQPRFNTSAQSTPIQATRVAQSPMTTAPTPIPAQMAPAALARPLQHPPGQRLTFLSDTRSEQRPPSRQEPTLRATQDTPPRSEPPQPTRGVPHVPNAADPQYIRNLVEEQHRAMRMQTQYSQQDRIEQIHRSVSAHRTSAQDSPLIQPMHAASERKPIVDEPRAVTPPRYPGSVLGRPPSLLGQSAFGQLGSQPFPSITGRGFNPSPVKREEPRPGSVPTVPPQPAPPPEPKRSNVMSLLNSEPEEPKPVKRDSAPSVPQRVASPAAQGHAHGSVGSQPGLPQPRRDLSFGSTQSSLGQQPQFQRSTFGQPPPASGSAPPPLKHENSGGSLSGVQQPKQDWAARVLGQSQAPSPAPQLERDVRPYYSHQQHHHRTSLLGSLGQTRANPSPPPAASIGHSRTPSLTQPSREPPREQLRSGLSGQQPGSQQPSHALQPNPYGSQQPSQFQSQPGQSQNHVHHAHNSSISSPFPTLHHRGISRDEQIRQEQRQQREHDPRGLDHGRDEQDRRWDLLLRQQQQQEHLEAERRQRDDQLLAQQRRRDDDERRALQQRNGPPPMPLQPPTFSAPSFAPRPGSLDLRGQSRIEAEMAVREQEERQRLQDVDRRQAMFRESQLVEADHRRRQEDARRQQQQQQQQDEAMFRRTPLGGGYGVPPPPPPPPAGQSGQRR